MYYNKQTSWQGFQSFKLPINKLIIFSPSFIDGSRSAPQLGRRFSRRFTSDLARSFSTVKTELRPTEDVLRIGHGSLQSCQAGLAPSPNGPELRGHRANHYFTLDLVITDFCAQHTHTHTRVCVSSESKHPLQRSHTHISPSFLCRPVCMNRGRKKRTRQCVFLLTYNCDVSE